jgi:hypothetical protein
LHWWINWRMIMPQLPIGPNLYRGDSLLTPWSRVLLEKPTSELCS